MPYIDNITGNVETTNIVGSIESVETIGDVTIVTAKAEVKSNNVSGKLGIAQIFSGSENDHSKLNNRDLPDQHPINSITGLKEALDNAGKVKDVVVNGNSVLDKDGVAKIENIGSNDKLYSSDDIDKDTYYSFNGLKTLDNIKIPISETETAGLIEAIYLLLDYDLEDLVSDYPYIKDTIYNIIIPKSDYISNIESKHLTIDLYNRGKIIATIKPLEDNYSFSKFTVINYLKDWGVSFIEGKSELQVLYTGEETDPTVPEHVKRITQYNINTWNNKADKSQIPTKTSQLTNDSGFITNLANNLINYYLKTESYSKEEINQIISSIQNVRIEIVDSLPTEGQTNVIYFVKKTGTENDEYDEWIFVDGKKEHIGSTKVDLTGYATEQWVESKDYMPIPDFHEYMNFFHYTKNQTDELLKEKVNINDLPTKTSQLENDSGYITEDDLPEIPEQKEYKADDNIVIENDTIKVFTNTGYEVSDKDVQLQSITDSGTTGENKIVYLDEKEIVNIYNGSNKIRRSKNGIYFEVITLPIECKYMVYNLGYNRLYGTNKSNSFIYSDDTGLTWQTIHNTYANGLHQMAIGFGSGFRATYKSTKEIINFTFNATSNNLSVNSRIKSTIVPEFTEMVNNTQFIWCNSTGTFKYGAGSQEGNFASLSGVTVNLLKRVNNITMLGLKNSNKIYLLEPATSITAYKWIEYTLPDTCTVNDIVFNPYDETYYIFTDINTYYKTKDFISFDSVDKNNLRGLQGHFTLMGIQMTTTYHDTLLLAPTRTTLEDKAQEWDRALNKELWIGLGLELTEEGKVNVKINGDNLGINANGIFLREIDVWHLAQDIVEGIYVGKAEEKGLFDPYEIENWYYSEEAYPTEPYKAVKFIFTQDGSFYDQVTWETEYQVEKYEYGYLFYDQNMSIFKYVKLGNLSWLLDLVIK